MKAENRRTIVRHYRSAIVILKINFIKKKYVNLKTYVFIELGKTDEPTPPKYASIYHENELIVKMPV